MENKELSSNQSMVAAVKSPNLRRTLIISIGVILIIGIFLIWYFYFRIDDSKLHSLESKIESNQDINKYFSNLSFSTNEQKPKVVTYKGITSYSYKLVGDYNKNFSQLSNDEKINVFTKVQDVIQQNGELVDCGYKKYCGTSEIDVVNSDASKIDLYSFDTAIGDITHSYDDKDGVPQTETISADSSSNSDSSNSNDADTNSNSSTNDSSVYDSSEQGQPTETNPSDSTSTDTTSQTTPKIGMTADEVRATKWGKPAEINKTTTAGDISEQWVYYDDGMPDRYVYLDNGIVTAVQESN